jgi:hypothetical protein
MDLIFWGTNTGGLRLQLEVEVREGKNPDISAMTQWTNLCASQAKCWVDERKQQDRHAS